MKTRLLFFVALIHFLLAAGPVLAIGSGMTTFGPVLDYRSSPNVDYSSLSVLGPIVFRDKKGSETEGGVRPLYYRAVDSESGRTLSEFLYPVLRKETERGQSRLSVLGLFKYDLGAREAGSDKTFTLFPLIFAGSHEEQGRYLALFPLGGKMYGRFGRKEIQFALFPLYGRTLKGSTQITNILWPIYARVKGPGESGIKLWPLFGIADKEGVYHKRFFLWPVYFDYHLRLDSDNPVHKRYVFPLYLRQESPWVSKRTILWPFFNYTNDRKKDFRRWDYPWPLFGTTVGERYHGQRLLPLFADETKGQRRKRWYLWPLYKIEDTQTHLFQRRRHRILYFLYSDLKESRTEEVGVHKRRISLWPLFTYEKIKGVSHFRTLSLLQPFFPENDGIRRNWSPLWTLYQKKWDGHGNRVTSVLWNLYWSERRKDGLAWEFFPLMSYFREDGEGKELKVLKGLIRYRRGPKGRKLSFFFLPWGDDNK